MMNRGSALAIVLGIALLSGGCCCCVDSYCNSSCDFGGDCCNRVSGTAAPQILPESNFGASGGCAATCESGGGGCDSCGWNGDECLGDHGFCGMGLFGVGGRSGCGWGCGPEVFVDGNGVPCYGPVMGLAMLLRDSFQSCGCGSELYVDEWISDPPLCNDPCDFGHGSGGDCGCGGAPSGDCCDSCDHGHQGNYARNYNWSRSKQQCGTCDQGYVTHSHHRSTPNKSRRNSIGAAIQKVSAQSPVKKWGNSMSQRMRSIDVEPALRTLEPISRQTRKSPNAPQEPLIRLSSWFN